MNIHITKISLILCLVFLLSCANTSVTPLWEIPDPDLDEIAMIRGDPNWHTVVIYNPDTCKQIGDACGFFRLHAYAHEILNHSLLGEPDDYTLSRENEADCYAAKYGKSDDVIAAIELFLDEDRATDIKIHGDPAKRAELVQKCFKERS